MVAVRSAAMVRPPVWRRHSCVTLRGLRTRPAQPDLTSERRRRPGSLGRAVQEVRRTQLLGGTLREAEALKRRYELLLRVCESVNI